MPISNPGGDMSGAEIKALYEVESNAFTDTLKTKLDTIEENADVGLMIARKVAAYGRNTTTYGTAFSFVATKSGTVSITCQLKCAEAGDTATATIFDGGTERGTMTHTGDTAYTDKELSAQTVTDGNTIYIKLKSSTASRTQYVKNMLFIEE